MSKENLATSPFLRGIKVVEFAGLAPVPFCGLLLADFGANVTLVINKSSKLAAFEQRLCRGKQKLWVDFNAPSDLEEIRALCKSADVLLDPYRPGSLEHYGLEPAKLMEENHGLVIARVTGYGQNGPMAARAGHDINYVALSGLLPTISGRASSNGRGPLWPPANLLADFASGGLLSAFAIVSALYRRRTNGGKGCILDCAMTEGLAYLGTFISLYRDQAWMWDDEFAMFSGKYPVYRTYKTADGKWIAVGALEPKFQAILFEVLHLQEIPEEPRELAQKLEEIFLSKSQAEWTELFKDKDACVTPVLDMDEQLGQFPHHKARGSFWLDEKSGPLLVPRPVPIEATAPGEITKSKL